MHKILLYKWFCLVDKKYLVPLIIFLCFASPASMAEEGGGHFQLHGDVTPIEKDGIHDPENDAVSTLQPPAEAMNAL